LYVQYKACATARILADPIFARGDAPPRIAIAPECVARKVENGIMRNVSTGKKSEFGLDDDRRHSPWLSFPHYCMPSTVQFNNSTVSNVGGDQYNIDIRWCCSHVPVAALSGSFSTFQLIAESVKGAQASQKQLEALARAIAQLLRRLDEQYCANSLLEGTTGIALTNLQELLREISAFVQKQADARRNFLTFLYAKECRISQIEVYYTRLRIAIDAFQISGLLNIQEWHARNDAARLADQDLLNNRFNKLEANHSELMETLDWNQANMIAMVASLQQRLDHIITGEREHSFISHSLRLLSTLSGRQVHLEKWTITAYDIEYVRKIGSGRFGDVYEGIWNKIPVALKVFKTNDGVVPSSAVSNHLHPFSNSYSLIEYQP
jgi:hypothetical protein